MIDHGLLEYLGQFVTPVRRARMNDVLAERTRYLTVLVEDIYQPHNASAVLRTCDCFGVQDVHIVENRNEYRLNPGVELGTAQWLSLHRYRDGDDNTTAAVKTLRAAGYRIVATTPHTNQCTLGDWRIEDGPAVLMFGTELDGLSERALELADEHLVIPMYGFVESFNISVSAAIILSSLSERLRSSGIDYHLTESQKEELLSAWIRGSVGRAEALEREYYRTQAGGTETGQPNSNPRGS